MVYRESKRTLTFEEWTELLKIMKRNMQKPDKIYTILLFLFSLQTKYLLASTKTNTCGGGASNFSLISLGNEALRSTLFVRIVTVT